jgi:hypothetical protein
MKTTTIAMFVLTLLLVMATACSGPSSVANKLVGEWQSTAPESVHLSFMENAAPTGPAGEGSGWRDLSYTEYGKTWSAYWGINSDSDLLVSSGGIGGNYSLNALPRKIITLSSDKLVLEWGYGGPVRTIEFNKVK